MDLGLQGKVALVMAASKGLGLTVATQLAQEGATVAIASRTLSHTEAAAQKVKQETGCELVPFQADVGRADDIQQLIEQISKEYGRLDILVTNAGGPPSGPFIQFDDGDWEDAFVRNLLSVVRLIRNALPLMEGGGRVVAIASSSVRQPIPGMILSNTMRAGIAAMIKTLAEELAEKGILLNTLCPGRIATDRLRELDEALAVSQEVSVEEVRQAWISRIPLGRYGEAEEFAKVAAFLASWANTYITGQILLVDGGLVRSL